jgi:hypothetical protein
VFTTTAAFVDVKLAAGMYDAALDTINTNPVLEDTVVITISKVVPIVTPTWSISIQPIDTYTTQPASITV